MASTISAESKPPGAASWTNNTPKRAVPAKLLRVACTAQSIRPYWRFDRRDPQPAPARLRGGTAPHLSPSSPIRTPEFLRGRERNLEQIRRAFVQPGRQVFIYGDRGVGKTSLALTAAYEHQPSDREPPILSCRGGFYEIMRDLLNLLAARSVLMAKETRSREFSFSQWIGAKDGKTVERARVGDMRSVNEVIAALKESALRVTATASACSTNSSWSPRQRTAAFFGDFIKALGDQDVPIRAIFCGIGDSVAALLDEHASATRYLASVELSRLSFDAGFEIMRGAQEGARRRDRVQHAGAHRYH